ncbi:Clavaminate synthase-like protein [Eremomyces bilateralis CBS 781.70]|uniref:Clavaminate synthase-like protein n=1 Tax=Eremomyces bilateralis CBS 781.70 TaxID=1392243 RepID=A0A6G1G875_9PEZI|nr:Clavaminate synthase-like protein [Eremomyces bilateralis CBS 781.70]KAF1814268.1 Clavaminate synthase-like protein [Eremomyces bilateralis CBS 781.70]
MQRLSCQFKPLIAIENLNALKFKSQFFQSSTPVLLRNTVQPRINAIDKWFDGNGKLDIGYLGKYSSTIVPLEHTVKSQDGSGTVEFRRQNVPLDLFLKWVDMKQSAAEGHDSNLYLAQASLDELPGPLIHDLPLPELVQKAGKGDVYGSSLWMGYPPTVTPLHRDPNPNLLVQLAGEKQIRMIAPDDGKQVFQEVKMRVGRQGIGRMRGVEMMGGEERRVAEDLIWGEKQGEELVHGVEACLYPGDAVFIPLSWWHAVRGVGGKISASVGITFLIVIGSS